MLTNCSTNPKLIISTRKRLWHFQSPSLVINMTNCDNPSFKCIIQITIWKCPTVVLLCTLCSILSWRENRTKQCPVGSWQSQRRRPLQGPWSGPWWSIGRQHCHQQIDHNLLQSQGSAWRQGSAWHRPWLLWAAKADDFATLPHDPLLVDGRVEILAQIITIQEGGGEQDIQCVHLNICLDEKSVDWSYRWKNVTGSSCVRIKSSLRFNARVELSVGLNVRAPKV